MIDDLTRSVVKTRQWLQDHSKEQDKPEQGKITQEQIEADIAYAEQNWIGEAKGNNARVLRLATALREAQAEVDRLREALSWYADPKNYKDDDWGVKSIVQPPEYGNPGNIARAALEAAKGK